MKLSLLLSAHRRLLLLLLATLLAVSTFYAPVVLDNVAGTNLTTDVLACGPPGGGC
jgi:hypothetical protein